MNPFHHEVGGGGAERLPETNRSPEAEKSDQGRREWAESFFRDVFETDGKQPESGKPSMKDSRTGPTLPTEAERGPKLPPPIVTLPGKSRREIAEEIFQKAFESGTDAGKEANYVNGDIRNSPLENGHWEGERGDSKWVPDPDYVPGKSNPEGKTWREILEQHGIDGVEFKDGEPVFDEVSKGTVEIEGFSSDRDDNFDKADIELAKQRGCTPAEVKAWRKENGYTWHECKDMKTMQKVPSEVHNNISHRGGVSNSKSMELNRE